MISVIVCYIALPFSQTLETQRGRIVIQLWAQEVYSMQQVTLFYFAQCLHFLEFIVKTFTRWTFFITFLIFSPTLCQIYVLLWRTVQSKYRLQRNKQLQKIVFHYTVNQKQDNRLLSVTSPNGDRLLQFLHW